MARELHDLNANLAKVLAELEPVREERIARKVVLERLLRSGAVAGAFAAIGALLAAVYKAVTSWRPN